MLLFGSTKVISCLFLLSDSFLVLSTTMGYPDFQRSIVIFELPTFSRNIHLDFLYFYRFHIFLDGHKTILKNLPILFVFTGKSFSEALILESVNPQYDERLFIELNTRKVQV